MAFVLSLMHDCGRNGTDDSLSLNDVHLEAFSPSEDEHHHHFSSELSLFFLSSLQPGTKALVSHSLYVNWQCCASLTLKILRI